MSIATAVVLVVVSAAGASHAATHDEAAHVREALMKNAAAFESGDMEALNKLWADDDSVLVFEQGHANHGWADYRDNHLAPELKELKNLKYALSDVKVKMAGANSAWATFKYSLSAKLGERSIEAEGLGTAVLEKRAGRWQIVHWHTSAPRRAPAAQKGNASSSH